MSNGSNERKITAGLDLGDRYTHLCLLDTDSGEVLEEGRVRTTPEGFSRRFDSAEPVKVALGESVGEMMGTEGVLRYARENRKLGALPFMRGLLGRVEDHAEKPMKDDATAVILDFGVG